MSAKIILDGEVVEIGGSPSSGTTIKPILRANYDALSTEEKMADVVYLIYEEGELSGT